MRIAELLQSLSDEQVESVLVGCLAVQLHGFLRARFDIDLVLAMSDANLSRIIAVANRPKDQLDIVALEKIQRGEDPNA